MRAALFVLSLVAFATPAVATAADAAQHSVPSAQAQWADAPLYQQAVSRARASVAAMMQAGIVVPAPVDAGGGYTHEQHKHNYQALYDAGQLYRITGEAQYADYVRDMLLAYAALYPTLGDHPARANQYSGRLFWQVLNDAVWLAYAIRGYEPVRASLSDADRTRIDRDVFRRAADFLSVESAATFNRIHNHATWATAGVGMTGYVLGDRDLVDRALLGSAKDGKTGFLRQTELLFSPDGYYAEGPYYQRYALMPFMLFASAIAQNEPARQIFAHREGILLKALTTTIQLTYAGRFFPFNDALKDKSLNTDELYNGVAIAYRQTGDPALLSIVEGQGRTILTEDGLHVARDLADGKARPFPFRSVLLRDGPQGDLGAVAVLRHGEGSGHQVVVAKNSSQGMGHGHFDKLSWQFYDNGEEVITDYGAARFLNILAKQGGRYLPENESWAKQTVAHNALVVDGTSHFAGDADLAEAHAPTQLAYAAGDDFSFSIATIDSASPGVAMTRNLALVHMSGLEHPVVVDILRADSPSSHVYDLPLHYQGHIMRSGPKLTSYVTARPVLGETDGYQHIWVDAVATPVPEDAFLTWKLGNRFYTWRWVPAPASQLILGETGANDPAFNLRREPLLIQRVHGQGNVLFAGVLESHGRYDGAAERTVASDSQIRTITALSTDKADVLVIESRAGGRLAVAFARDTDPDRTHEVRIGTDRLRWTGAAARIPLVASKNP